MKYRLLIVLALLILAGHASAQWTGVINPMILGNGCSGAQTTSPTPTLTINIGVQSMFIADRDLVVPNNTTICKVCLYLNIAHNVDVKIIKYVSGTSIVNVVADSGPQIHPGGGFRCWPMTGGLFRTDASSTYWIGAAVTDAAGVTPYNLRNDTELYGVVGCCNISGNGVTLTDNAARETLAVGYQR